MSVIAYESKDVGAIAYEILMNNEYCDALKLIRDHHEAKTFSLGVKDEYQKTKCFFDRLYIANQLANFTSYDDECNIDGSFTIRRLQPSDISKPGTFRGRSLRTKRGLWDALTSMRYNIVTNQGHSFFDEEDCERLDNLINYIARELIDMQESD